MPPKHARSPSPPDFHAWGRNVHTATRSVPVGYMPARARVRQDALAPQSPPGDGASAAAASGHQGYQPQSPTYVPTAATAAMAPVAAASMHQRRTSVRQAANKVAAIVAGMTEVDPSATNEVKIAYAGKTPGRDVCVSAHRCEWTSRPKRGDIYA